MVFQDPMTSLHPMLTIGRQLTEHMRRHLGLDRQVGRRARGRAARGGPHPRPRGGAPRLSAPVLGRHAAAHRDRDRARLRAQAADRGRADDGARRHRAGRHPAAARPPAARERPRRPADHPRPRGDVGDRRPRLGLLRRPGRRVGSARARCCRPAPSLHPGAPRRAAAPGDRRREAARRDPRRSADPGAIPPGCAFNPRCGYAEELLPRRDAARSSCSATDGSPATSTPSRGHEHARAPTTSSSTTSAAGAAASARSRARA